MRATNGVRSRAAMHVSGRMRVRAAVLLSSVTAGISLAGRTLVYLPGAREIGVSRRLTDDAERVRLREILEGLPGDGGFIARTAALGRSARAARAATTSGVGLRLPDSSSDR